MAEIIAVGASLIAVIQVADRIIRICKSYISSVHDAPSNLRAILIEISAVKAVFENLKFLDSCKSPTSPLANGLSGADGPIEGCLRSVNDLAGLFSTDDVHVKGQGQSKRRKIKSTLVSLAWPLKETRARKLLEDILRYKSTITLALMTDTFQDIKDTKVKAFEIHDMMTARLTAYIALEKQRQEVYQWLHHTDPCPNHHRAQKNYESGTGDWILRSPEWLSWLEREIRCLWIHGIPGAGKTVLMSHLIEQIKKICDESRNKDIVYVYYYCYFARNQDETKPFLKWLISQLCRKAEHVPAIVNELRKHGGDPSVADLLDSLASILTRFKVVYLAVDAIDESDPREDLLATFQEFVAGPRFGNLQLIASSREYIDIERIMTGKTMADVSISVSMNNPYIELDIRRYVQSFIESCHPFKRWPRELLHEVEETVVTGAKGMSVSTCAPSLRALTTYTTDRFRWAVCQLDVIRRLKCERDIVMKALRNLPRTLDETYDRVFAIIPEDERLIVHHVLGWIAYNNELYAHDIPCEVLIQAAEASTNKLTGEQIERFYDQDTLQELCGCLIEVSPAGYIYAERALFTVKFAHFTVFEYLESGRISKSALARHDAVETLREHFIEVTLIEAQKVKCQKLSTEEKIMMAPYSSFTNYCVASGTRCLYKWPDRICQQNVLRRLVVDFLNPSKPHFEAAVARAKALDSYVGFVFTEMWDINWNPEVSTDAKHLYYILLLYWVNHGFAPLIKDFLQEHDQRHLLQSRLTFRQRVEVRSSYRFEGFTTILFDGSVVEVLAQHNSDYVEILLFLMEISAGLFDPSVTLLLSIRDHDEHGFSDGKCEKICHVLNLLKFGADPNLRGYKVTPLQIAAYCLDIEGASMLLQYGAHPSSTGCIDGAAWKKGTMMSYLNHLHGASPLRILRKYTYISPKENEEYQKRIYKARQKLEKLLLQYGAEDISSTPNAALNEVKYDTAEWDDYAMTIPHVQAYTNHQCEEDLSATSADDSV